MRKSPEVGPQDYEKLGAFYLGKEYDVDAGEVTDDLLLYDAKDLTTHAMCVGMTGSGKTGLCVGLLEEAAIDGIPTIAIDPKGDLGNLMLTFPKLRAEDFRPWIDEAEAARKGMSPDEYAKNRAALWRKGLESWGQDAERIQRFRDCAEVAIYTPGGSAGIPLTVLDSFSAPPNEVLEDPDAFRERIMSAVSGLLTLLDIDADPIQSREHILISNILQHAWQDGKSLDLPGIIHAIQDPPFERIGVLDLESFYKAKERFGLAMKMNNLLASPGFAAWSQGEPLDVKSLLWTAQGKPRIAILSIAHLSDTERMFFVTLLLNEVLAWMRTQPGTGSLRALLYMDEVFGYFPPTANPPSKTPMLTLLKQARAFGLGCVLATQNPVDLDYKGLSNCGTWFLGRLQTERDKMRVMEGLEGASAQAGAAFDKRRMEETLARLGSRVFLMNNVHDENPVLFHTRWVLSYLRGPMTKTQIQKLMGPKKEAAKKAREKAETAASKTGAAKREKSAAAAVAKAPVDVEAARPVVPNDVEECFLAVRKRLGESDRVVYRPGLLGRAKLHYVRASLEVDDWRDADVLTPVDEENLHDPWEDLQDLEEVDVENKPEEDATFGDVPSEALTAKRHKRWARALKNHLYSTRKMDFWRCKKPKLVSEPGESERDFRARLTQAVHEERDRQLEKMRKRYAPKLDRIKDRVRRAEQKLEREEEEYEAQRTSTIVSFGRTILGALFGRKKLSAGNVGRAASTARSVSRAKRQKGDIARAKREIEAQERALEDLEQEFQEELEEVREGIDISLVDVEHIPLAPRKSDIDISQVALAWMPWRVSKDGIAAPAWRR